MDKGMKKVVNLVTNYMSALCETGRVPGRVDRNIEAGTAVYFPGGGASEVIESPEDKESNQKTVIFMTFEEAKQQAIDRSE